MDKKNILPCIQIILVSITISLVTSLHFLYEIEKLNGVTPGYWFTILTNSKILINVVLYSAISCQVIIMITVFFGNREI